MQLRLVLFLTLPSDPSHSSNQRSSPTSVMSVPLGRQSDRQPDTTHSNTTSQRRDHLSASCVETLDVSAPASGLLAVLLIGFLKSLSVLPGQGGR